MLFYMIRSDILLEKLILNLNRSQMGMYVCRQKLFTFSKFFHSPVLPYSKKFSYICPLPRFFKVLRRYLFLTQYSDFSLVDPYALRTRT